MNTYDVTLTISEQLPTWPGDPKVKITQISKIENGADSNVSHVSFPVHVGTHVDAPHHFISGGDTVDNLAIKVLTGRAYVQHLLDVDVITEAVLVEANIPPRTRRVLFRTKNSEMWTQDKIEFNTDYVGLSADAAAYLVQRGVKLIGVDYLSVAPYHTTKPTHEILLKAGVVIVEGLNLSGIEQGRYTMYCLPLKIKDADGAPARTILVGV